MSDNLKFLVIGAGSAGGRHSSNLSLSDCIVDAFDPRDDRIKSLLEAGTIHWGTSNWQELSLDQYDAFVIASPPVFHAEQVESLAKLNRWIFCEKPLTIDHESAFRLLSVCPHLFLGYTYRWWPPIRRYRELLRSNAVGRPRTARFVMSANLADWHPWEPYQDFFMSKKEMGGGALLDESHFIDLMLWFFGLPEFVYANISKISSLEISADDNVDLFFKYPDGLRVNMHLDLIGRPHRREIYIVGEDGTLEWSYEDNCIKYGPANSPEREDFSCERNTMFRAAMEEFIELVRGAIRPADITCNLKDGITVMRIIDAARQSNQDRCAVQLANEFK